MTTLAALTVCALILWRNRKPIMEHDDPNMVAWTSPVDDSYFEVLLPGGLDAFDVWETLAWIGSLPEVELVG